MAQRICVTGASGQAGRAVVAGLREHGYHVTPTDVPAGCSASRPPTPGATM
jgi:nucleoside-diphosphate-sugar epimerase